MNVNPGPAQKSEKWLSSAVVMTITAIFEAFEGMGGGQYIPPKKKTGLNMLMRLAGSVCHLSF